MCALGVSSGSFLIGAVCGVVVAVGILKAQGKFLTCPLNQRQK